MDRILLLLDREENQHLVEGWLGPNHRIVSADAGHLLDVSFDLGILDGPALDRLWERLRARRETERPVFLPFLLIASRQDAQAAARHLGQVVDELILTPIEKLELQARVEVLLRTRRLSVELYQRYQRLFENVPLGLYRTTSDGRILDANEALVEMLGYPDRGALMDIKTIRSYVDPEDRRQWQELMERQGFARRFEAQLRRRDGSIIWVEDNAQVVRDDGGRVLYYEGSLQDVTERKRAEEALGRSLEQLAIINELGRSLAATLDLHAIYRTACECVQRLVDCPNFGISLFNLEEQTITAAFMVSDGEEMDLGQFPPLTHKPEARTGRSKAIASGRPVIVYDQARAFRESDQAYRIGDGLEPLTALYVPMIVEGQVIGLLEVQSYQERAYRREDIELLGPVANQIGLAIQNARLFGETRQLKEFNEGIIQSMIDGIVVGDSEGRITFVNLAAAEMLGYVSEELVGLHWRLIVPPDQHPIIQAASEWRTRGERGRYELELVRKDGSRLPVLASGSPRLDNGRFAGFIVVFTDITERKRAEEELRRYREHLEELVRERTAELRRLVGAMAGREVRMAELKEVIRKLRAQLQEAGMTPVADDPLLGERREAEDE